MDYNLSTDERWHQTPSDQGASVWSDLGKMEKWSARKILKSDKDEWEIGYMELNNLV